MLPSSPLNHTSIYGDNPPSMEATSPLISNGLNSTSSEKKSFQSASSGICRLLAFKVNFEPHRSPHDDSCSWTPAHYLRPGPRADAEPRTPLPLNRLVSRPCAAA
eukprot:750164-Hanusia_phi.AAC.1